MEQTKPSQSLPDNAYRELKPGEEYVPMMPADAKPKEGHSLFGYDGPADGRSLLRRRSLSGPAHRPGVRSSHTDRHYRRRRRQHAGQKKHAGTERHHTVDRRLVGHHRRRSDLHPAGALHPRFGNRILQSIPLVGTGRYPGHRAAHPLPEIFRQGDARQVPFPGGDGHDRSARIGRKRRQSGQAAGRSRTGGRSVRLRSEHLRPLDGRDLDPHDGLGHPLRR